MHEQSISFPTPPGLCWLRRDSSLQAPSNTIQRACGQKNTKIEKQQTSKLLSVFAPAPPGAAARPGGHAPNFGPRRGSEVFPRTGRPWIKLSKHKSTEKNEKCLHHLCQRHAKALSLDLMQGTQYLAPTLVRNVKFSSFGNTAEMVCRGKKHGERAAHS